MPYVVTVTRPAEREWVPDAYHHQEFASSTVQRGTAATLDEAQNIAADILNDEFYAIDSDVFTAAILMIDAMGADGGTVGPLPGGASIQVTPV